MKSPMAYVLSIEQTSTAKEYVCAPFIVSVRESEQKAKIQASQLMSAPIQWWYSAPEINKDKISLPETWFAKVIESRDAIEIIYVITVQAFPIL